MRIVFLVIKFNALHINSVRMCKCLILSQQSDLKMPCDKSVPQVPQSPQSPVSSPSLSVPKA
ncbi:hypothetical protein PHYBLDRAFT_143068 [Phycomyces blakesleeanus NRRL 1555(-)]|uniref:Uncharacterized protein n=1 Tax=Phycomyces blakesleeanus (strain ATCC 8743b / DSM 1359 / FGSC 10004 / NBRC 33097 / NRRL 1555) TaxID=763407 RepID=A0A162XQ00_PHYB8|nr:hypothetical protein PHYBLDRAFT_143068 [Phycomyces blakesleeanus NRRL 1555(-)]OAD76085.1 hypothetical protein PHYBLDRAFT_143068 [Phycomyces blakesleeanus NRRL 1555(-)]|eukprot:XP_018294125.1 hypothetical protein PHYBLDRAFT_143068 [Phycomyces blakesleeanus NRRL 1555(-)]